jgi:hypothetical protein
MTEEKTYTLRYRSSDGSWLPCSVGPYRNREDAYSAASSLASSQEGGRVRVYTDVQKPGLAHYQQVVGEWRARRVDQPAKRVAVTRP